MRLFIYSFAFVALGFMSFRWICGNIFPYQPPHFPVPSYPFQDNPPDSLMVEIGKRLFFDPKLSADNSISCASCHSPFNAFAHTDHELSHGIHDSIGNRNAPALFNLAWQQSFMWDGAINHLDVQPLAPISHAAEMGSSINEVIQKIEGITLYRNLYFEACGDSSISSAKILKALAQYQLTLVSANSKYDRVVQGREKFSVQEENGYKLFLKNCNRCHTEPLFSNFSFEKNGLVLDPDLNDQGRYRVTLLEEDRMKFKVPSLRNLVFTYPYMHDGRFATLKEVIHHYAGDFNTKLDSSEKASKAIILNPNDQVDLIAFLLTLSDKEFVFDPKHLLK
ncbi:MAG: c-type cytochrome [Saprospiraceae bacterium]|jgi:cytochrome c peroxidase|nr:c-type cytochrome [Saprospiraceae bacterium]